MNAMPPRRRLHQIAHELERRYDRRTAGRTVSRKVIITPYRGFGRGNELLVRGRVLVDKRITRATAAEPLWRNILNTYRRFQSDELAGVRVVASFREAVVESVTDDEGYFQMRLQCAIPSAPGVIPSAAGVIPSAVEGSPAAGDASTSLGMTPTSPALSRWLEVNLHLPDHDATAVSHVLLPSPHAQFGVISDIDDTIVRTNATSLLRMTRSIVNNAAARLPFEGVADLYRALHVERNPIFYVSSSPWNLYELLHDYMDINGIPHGPMLLQDWGIDETILILASHTEHKLAQIQTVVDYYPELKWVLIGDSGQHDPEIYLRVIQSHPGRVLAAFIRDVTPDLRDRGVAQIVGQSNAAGVEMLYVRDSAEGMEHARRIGLIS